MDDDTIDCVQRTEVYKALAKALAQLHSVDIAGAGLQTYGRPSGYSRRQVPTKPYAAYMTPWDVWRCSHASRGVTSTDVSSTKNVRSWGTVSNNPTLVSILSLCTAS